jgi:hypothetical protein
MVFLLAFQGVPAMALFFDLFFSCPTPCPEGQDDVAIKVLRRLHYNGSNVELIVSELSGIKATISAEREITASGWLVMPKVPQWQTRLLGTAVQVFTQITGINVTGHYQNISTKHWESRETVPLFMSGVYNVVGPLANLVFIIFLLSHVGRRKRLLFETAGITFFFVCEGALNSP